MAKMTRQDVQACVALDKLDDPFVISGISGIIKIKATHRIIEAFIAAQLWDNNSAL